MNSFISRNFIYPVLEVFRDEPMRRCLKELDRTQWYSRDQFLESQWKKLSFLIDYCYRNVPFYKRKFDEAGIIPTDVRSLDDLPKLPYLSKNDVKFHSDELRSKAYHGKIEHCHSGGTLGKPLNFVRDSLSSAYIRASELRGLSWFGIKVGDKQARVWGIPLNTKVARREFFKDLILNRLRFSPFKLDKKVVLSYYRKLLKFKPTYIYGYPSAVFKICQIIDKMNLRGEKLGIKLVVTTAEALYPGQRSLIENVLKCKVVNEYGCSEVGVVAFECPEGNLHLTMENILVEFLNTNQNSGEKAEILLTNLNGFAMPFLRYRIGDTGKLLNGFCPCGRQSLMMDFEAGRVLDDLIAYDGTYVSGTVFCYIAFDVIEKYKGIEEFRVVQKSQERLRISLVKDEHYDDRVLNIFDTKLRSIVGSKMKIDYVFLNEIPPEKSGKRRFVYSEIIRERRRCNNL